MKKYKGLKISIISVLLLCIILFILYYVTGGKNSVLPYNRKFTQESEEMFIEEEKKDQFEKVKYRYQYYTVEALVNRYLTYLNDSIYDETDIKEASQEALYSIMDSTYLEDFNISNKEDLVERYEDFKEKEEIEIKNIYIYELENNVDLFLVKGWLKLAEKDVQIFIKLDMTNSRFSVFPNEYLEKNEYSEKAAKEDLQKFSELIEENEYNKFKQVNVSDERMAVVYFNDLKNTLLGNVEKAYNYIDEEYRNKRFGNIENFQKYLENNKSDLSNIEISSYLVNRYEDYTEFVCKDQFQNVYVIKETAVMDYTVELDDYTLDYKFQDMVNEYNSSNDQYKIAYNINKWVKMANSRDYDAAYKVLDKTFRETEFGSVEKFEEYMRRAFPEHYEIEFGEFNKESGIYTLKVIFNDVTGNEQNRKEKTILMRLEDDMNFVMSFNITKADYPM